jgi:hypothetical protein
VPIKKLCKYCNENFETIYKHILFCSRSCASKYKWKNDLAYHNSMIAFQKDYQNKPESIEANSNCSIELWSSLAYKEKMSKIQKSAQNNPLLNVERSRFHKEYQNRPDVKEKNIRRMIELWKNPEYAHKVQINGFKYKDYVLPSGEIIKIQGYENKVLDELLETYSEDDIIAGVSDMYKKIGQIPYIFNNHIHNYLPDIFIISENKIIEVKSKYWYDMHKKQNLAKEHGCLQQGFNFEFRIF